MTSGCKAEECLCTKALSCAAAAPPRDEYTSRQDFYSEAKVISDGEGIRWRPGSGRNFWYGNFFPDMRAWDKLDALQRRGAGGKSVMIQFAGSDMSCHMSVFPSR